MDVFLILLGLVILCGVAYIVFKLSNNSNISLEESHEKKSEELKQMKNILSLEFKNLSNEIFEEKSNFSKFAKFYSHKNYFFINGKSVGTKLWGGNFLTIYFRTI